MASSIGLLMNRVNSSHDVELHGSRLQVDRIENEIELAKASTVARDPF